MRKKHFLIPILILSLIASPLAILPVHATSIQFKSLCHAHINPGTTINCSITNLAIGDALVVNIFGLGAFNAFTVSDGTNTYTQRVASVTGGGSGASTYIVTAISSINSIGSFTITVSTGGASRIYGFTLSDYSGVTGFGQTGTDQQESAGNSGTSTVTLNGISSASIMVDDFYSISSTFTITANNGQTIRDSGTATNCDALGQCRAADSPSPILGWSWSGGSEACPCSVSHSVLEMQGNQVVPGGVVQCYGNCGSPPITLANTNSTHGFLFNNSITVFYEFQSNLNGALVNVTSSLAKATNPNQVIAIGIYQISSCPAGLVPFSSACPGFLIQSAQFSGITAKGRFATPTLNIPVSAGQWQGISISAMFSPLDLNDTNANVALFQTNGNTPLSITNAATTTCACKMSLWAWISGTTVTTNPFPTTGPCSNGFGGIDCIFSSIVSSFCSVQTSTCLWASGLFWVGILTVVFTLMVPYGMKEIGLENQKIPMGNMILFFGILWMLVFTGLGLLPIWAPLVIFFLLAWEVKGKIL